MANYYKVACLSIDAVVIDVLIKGASPVSLRAKQLYESAVAKYKEKKTTEASKYESHTNTHRYIKNAF